MSERSSITNLLLLTVLTGILLVSGSLQCACDCLTRLDNNYRPAVRVTDCHFVFRQPTPIVSCPNEACHQGDSHQRSLGGPEYHNLLLQDHSLASSSHSVNPEYKAGDPFELPFIGRQPQLANNSGLSQAPFQSLREIRTTVLLN